VEVTEADEENAKEYIVADISMKALLESGVHFGHRTHRWNPKMKPYIFTERNGIHIIDLEQTVKALESARELIRDVVADGGTVLFVGTKRQAADTIQLEAERCGMPYVTVRWLGGMLTNWRTMRERIQELERLERMRERGDFERLTKKEALSLERQIAKLEDRFGGIRKMIGLPDLLFVVDTRREDTAVNEANILNIPVVALVDTNCDPMLIDHVIPSNDDAIRAIKLLVALIADAVLEGRALRKEEEVEEAPAEQVERVGEGEELTDEELLGEATLDKMRAQAEAEAEARAEQEAEEAQAEEDEQAEAASEEGEAEDEQPEEEADEEPEAQEETSEEDKSEEEEKTKKKGKKKK